MSIILVARITDHSAIIVNHACKHSGVALSVKNGSGRVDALRVRVYPLLPVKKVPKSHNY